jgi:hypothetical protein
VLRRLLASAALLTFAATFASAEPKHPKPHPKSIARLQADIRRDEAALAAAQRARDPAAIAREQADLARDRAQLQQLQAGVRPRPRPDTSDKHGKKGKKHHHHKKDR